MISSKPVPLIKPRRTTRPWKLSPMEWLLEKTIITFAGLVIGLVASVVPALIFLLLFGDPFPGDTGYGIGFYGVRIQMLFAWFGALAGMIGVHVYPRRGARSSNVRLRGFIRGVIIGAMSSSSVLFAMWLASFAYQPILYSSAIDYARSAVPTLMTLGGVLGFLSGYPPFWSKRRSGLDRS